MTWNYRVILLEGVYAVHEVFYENEAIIGWTGNPVAPLGDTVPQLVNDLEEMKRAVLGRPVLTVATDDNGDETLVEVTP